MWVVVLLAGVLGPGPASAQVRTVPLRIVDDHVWVQVDVEGMTPGWFILDTGASVSVLDARTAARLGGSVSGGSELTGAGGARVRSSRVSGVRMVVAGVVGSDSLVTVLPLDSVLSRYVGMPVPGIVGFPFFRDQVVTLDFEAGVMTLDPFPAPVVARATIVPLEFEGAWPVVRVRVASGVERIEARVVVDLGAKLSYLSGAILPDGAFARSSLAAPLTSVGAGIGGETRYHLTRADSLSVGGAPPVSRPLMAVTDPSLPPPGGLDGMLGLSFLRHYRVTFDYPNRRMILEPGRAFAAPEGWDRSGLFLVDPDPSDRRLTVERVARGSPAAAVGVLLGDEIILDEVDEGALPDVPVLEAARLQFRREAGSEVGVTVLRGATLIRMTLVLKDLY